MGFDYYLTKYLMRSLRRETRSIRFVPKRPVKRPRRARRK